ncbi:MAG TPA: hypothetical protein PKW35_01525 [Nannocystaceae bacterium]|nr:hypothetical protein [Nannocystaceae bacterium]
MSKPRLPLPLTLVTLLACQGGPIADPSATDTDPDTDTGTTSGTSTTGSTSDPTTTGSTGTTGGEPTGDPTSTSSTGDVTGSTGDMTGDDTTGEPAPICGDGNPDAGEECDNGAGNGDDQACTAGCMINVCGDGKQGPAEGCDDGNLEGGDGCSAACVPPPEATTLKLEFSPIKHFDFSWLAADWATYYQLTESADGVAPYEQIGGDIAGESISLTMPLHLRFGARYILRACNDEGCADSAPVEVVDSMATAVGYFKASNTDAGDAFGTIDVELSADGNTLVIGSHQEDSAATGIDGDQTDNTAANAGAVYVFVRVNDVWSQQAYLKASNTDAGDLFGYSLALSADGDLLAVGAWSEDSAATGVGGDQADDTAAGAGAVYIFERAAGVWSQQAYLKSSNAGAADQFGVSVALSSDGATLAVGANSEDSAATGIGGNQVDNSAANAGAVYVFTRVKQAWSQQAYVKASNAGAGDQFGARVALSGDGDTLAVGATFEDSAAIGVGGDQADNASTNAGAVYTFVRVNDVWSQQAYIKASNTGAGDQFGGDVALSVDGHTLAVGARFEDSNATGVNGDEANNLAIDAGAAFVFRRVNQVWAQEAYIKASNTGAGDTFGAPLVLSADGNTLAVGGNQEDSAAIGVGGDQADDSVLSAGAVHVYLRVGQTWSQRAYVKASTSDVGDFFGSGLGLSGDGKTLAVGAYAEDSPATGIGGDQATNAASLAGAVFLY